MEIACFFFISRYPEKVEYWILKVSMWVFACLFGGLIGKYFVHQFILQRILKLQLLKRNRGSWTIMLFTTMFMLYCFSLLFNYIGKLDNELKPFQITREMGIRYKTFMNGVGLVSFFTHLIFSMMVTDTILQVNNNAKSEKQKFQWKCKLPTPC